MPILPPAGLAQEAEGRRDATVSSWCATFENSRGLSKPSRHRAKLLQSLVPVRC